MKWLRGLAGILLVLLVAVAVMYGLGRRLPVEHVAMASGLVEASQDRVWELISDTAEQPNWRTDLVGVMPHKGDGESSCWVEATRSMEMPLCLMVEEPKVRRVVRVGDPTLPFAGTWTYELAPVAAGTAVTITERGRVRPALWRFVGHYVMGEDTNVKQYLKDLQVEAVRQR